MTAEQQSDFIFESVLFESPRISGTVELKYSVTDFEVFEHILKPYLTATLALTDSQDFVSDADILGAETITVQLRSLRKDSITINKRFYVDSIKSNQKTNDNSQFVILHLIEDVAYEANLKNINRAYSGKCTDILNKVAKGYLNKEIYSTETDRQSVKVIIPNLNPLETVQWITNRATTVNGYPFYTYSTLVGEKLIFADLGSLLIQEAINKDVPYRYYQGASQAPDATVRRRTILEFQQSDTEDLFTLIRKGLVGGHYTYINTLKNTRDQFHFDVTKDLLIPLVNRGVIPKKQGNVMYSPDYILNEKSYNELDSKFITQIGGTNSFDDLLSYSESNELADYKLNILSRAMHQYLNKAPMQVDLNGLDFIDGDAHYATGNIVNLEFLKSKPEDQGQTLTDAKKTGDYLITATQYMFKRERCNVRLSCTKLGNARR